MMERQGFDMENLPPPDDDDDSEDDWPEPPLNETAAERSARRTGEVARRAEVLDEIAELQQTIEDRLRHGVSEADVAGDQARLEAYQDELTFILEEEEEPILVASSPSVASLPFDPRADFERALAELSEDERELVAAIQREETQTAIADRLGITQSAVVKREAKLRAKLNPIHRRLFGHDWSILERGRIAGRQGRRRRQE